MNSTFSFSVGRLVAGLPRLSIREAHTRARMGRKKPDPTPNQPKGPRVPKPDVSFGETIWLFNHTDANHVTYSHKAPLKANKALRQIPFNGKNLRPPSIRKDYWQPMAMIEFPEGQGEVGRSVLQKLREFRKRHELEWGDPNTRAELAKLIKPWKKGNHELGRALNDQKANSVADIAAVLGGAGKGNLIWVRPQTEEDPGELHKATVHWRDELDQDYAQSWPENVEHRVGLPEILGPKRSKKAKKREAEAALAAAQPLSTGEQLQQALLEPAPATTPAPAPVTA